MKEVLVTGGAGYIGAHVCRELASNGYLPVTVDNLSTGFRHNVKWGPFYELDLREERALQNLFSQRKFHGVIHLASSAYVEESQRKPLKYFDNNLKTTLSVLNLVKHFQIRNLIFSSSCSVYGSGTGLPFKEDSELVPFNNYGFSKKMCEDIITSVAKELNINTAILRFFNACGVADSLEIAEEHNPETHVIPLLINAAIDQSKTFKVYGTEFDTLDGSPARDFVHVLDLASAHVLALDYVSDSNTSIVANLGSGNLTSVMQLVGAVRDMGFNPRIEFHGSREGDPPSLVADIARAHELLGWKPINSTIDKILKSSIMSAVRTI